MSSCFICDLFIYLFLFLFVTAGDEFLATEAPEFSKRKKKKKKKKKKFNKRDEVNNESDIGYVAAPIGSFAVGVVVAAVIYLAYMYR